ncbi:hypothetical protein [Variovorax sp. Sphag1AA]|uniref:hypothetical protein n=1 Tax=Variovorax sp. Sphag1AA TaxID=2587027 RepID=UPI00160AB76B|nr:hypothetical protein [Variovorax sp. Sphag1AA]MBB3180950.1 hypothetical protein [Variovorax sp. Sphag1AA]
MRHAMSSTHIYNLSDFPNLRQASFELYTSSRRQYRTRLKEVAPPAAASVISAQDLPLAASDLNREAQALLVRLPPDWQPHLEQLVAAAPAVVVQPDTGLDAQAAYLSMSVPLPAPQLPRAIWLEVVRVLELSAHNLSVGGSGSVPIVFTAGTQFVLAEFSTAPELMRRCEDAVHAEGKKPDVGKTDLTKAKQVAANYGERPWLFMRYDVRVGARKLAVNWAGVIGRLPACVL